MSSGANAPNFQLWEIVSLLSVTLLIVLPETVIRWDLGFGLSEDSVLVDLALSSSVLGVRPLQDGLSSS